jgi:hypothetical protein
VIGQREQRARGALQRDGVSQRSLGIVLLVLAVVPGQVRRDREQAVLVPGY